MNIDLRYLGRSEMREGPKGSSLRFSPNLSRPAVFFDAELRYPLRFREAISALHDVVVGDHRFKKKDKTAYLEWKKQQTEDEQRLRSAVYQQAHAQELAKLNAAGGPPANLDADFRRMHALYWRARRQWAAELARTDPELWRHLVPCDPVVTVAPDVVFFECFAKDESSYGCLLVDREALGSEGTAGLGTTNVDYSMALYEHFQTLRTYRPTRLQVDPSGFEVKVEGHADYREEKIELPPSWLRGFGQLQAAMGLPSRTVTLPVETVYSLLAYLKRHREKTGPRSVRFVLEPGKAPRLFLEPWNVELTVHGPVFEGERAEEVKVWGRRRLMVLSRVLPLVEKVEVALLGTGLPSVWTAHLGEMKFVLALSGWTANDWTSGSNLELLTGGFRTEAHTTEALRSYLQEHHRATLKELDAQLGAPRDVLLGCLNLLCKQGQVMFDFGTGVYRWRQVMPSALSETLLGPEHPELTGGRELWRTRQVKILREDPMPAGKTLYTARVGSTPVEAMLDGDGTFTKAKCQCSYFHTKGLRAGPCRHLLALRFQVQGRPAEDRVNLKWYERWFK